MQRNMGKPEHRPRDHTQMFAFAKFNVHVFMYICTCKEHVCLYVTAWMDMHIHTHTHISVDIHAGHVCMCNMRVHRYVDLSMYANMDDMRVNLDPDSYV